MICRHFVGNKSGGRTKMEEVVGHEGVLIIVWFIKIIYGIQFHVSTGALPRSRCSIRSSLVEIVRSNRPPQKNIMPARGPPWKLFLVLAVGFLFGRVERRVSVIYWHEDVTLMTHPTTATPTRLSENVLPQTNQPPPPSVPPSATDPISRVLNNTLILIPLNMGYLEFGLNLLCSLRKLNITNYIFLAMDEMVFDVLLAKRIPVYVDKALPFVMSEAGTFGEEKYHRLLCLKLLPVINLLKKGVNVLFTDADIVWLRDPTPHLRWDLDLLVTIGGCQTHLRDNCPLQKDKGVSMCTGFYFAQAKPATVDLFTRTLSNCISLHIGDPRFIEKAADDQTALNSIINEDREDYSYGFTNTKKYSYGFFDGCRFANGCVYFKHLCKGMEGYKEEVIVHANYVVGKEEKIHNLNRSGLWYESCVTGMYSLGFSRPSPRTSNSPGSEVEQDKVGTIIYD